MDDLDHQIIEKLRENDKLSYKKIGKALKKPASTIHFRVKKMIDEEIIVKFSAIIDMEKLGYNTVGWLGLTIDPLMRDEIIKKLASYKLIKMISSTTGDYNLIVQILAEDEKKLWSFIRDNIQIIEGIHDVHVSSSLKIYKWETSYFLKL